MLSSDGRSLFTISLVTPLATRGLWLGTLISICGCAEYPPVPPKPPVENTQPQKKDSVDVTPTEQNKTEVPLPKPEAYVVDSRAEMKFEGLSANEKLDRIAEAIRSSWGNGQGFLYVPQAAVATSSEDPMVLTLRWQSVEKKIAPLMQQAFGIEGTLVCRFTSPGEFECNHPVYQLAIQRAQNRPEEFAVIHKRADATLVNTAPVLRKQFLQQVGRQAEFYEAIRTSLKSMALPGQLEFSADDKDSSADNQQCVLFTKWTALPPEFEKSTDAGTYQWRLKLVIREAVDAIESEWDNLRTTKNRLELVSFAQHRLGQDEPFAPAGPLSITVMGFDPDTTIQRWGKKFIALKVPAQEVLNSLDDYHSVDAYPNPATFVGESLTMRTLVHSVHQAIQQQLTESIVD